MGQTNVPMIFLSSKWNRFWRSISHHVWPFLFDRYKTPIQILLDARRTFSFERFDSRVFFNDVYFSSYCVRWNLSWFRANKCFFLIHINISVSLSLLAFRLSLAYQRSIDRSECREHNLFTIATNKIDKSDRRKSLCTFESARKKGKERDKWSRWTKKRYIMDELNTLAWLISLTSESITPPFVWEP